VREPEKEPVAKPMTELMTEPLLRRMELRDLPSVMEIDAACLPRPWSEAVWREELRSPFSLYLVLEEDLRTEVGRARRAARGTNNPRFICAQIGVKHVSGELHVTTVAVRPERRRIGYARSLIHAVIAAFPEARYVHLEVRPSNGPARALYEALGFAITGRRRRYYGDEDALLMTLDLGENPRQTSGASHAPYGPPPGVA
ncbi:MAG: GNAT family N-acetyltransferase, partial [Actinomycetota bacterium]|jgi:ribosomal-protein-alanine N-acetyltransferase|nr:GNAT family N-acetyltransferase [Actinomycetota bacterium]